MVKRLKKQLLITKERFPEGFGGERSVYLPFTSKCQWADNQQNYSYLAQFILEGE